MTFLLTGAAGFIGSSIAKSLLKLGHTVIGVDNLSIAVKDKTRAAGWQSLKNHPRFCPLREDINSPSLHLLLEKAQQDYGQIKIALHFAAIPGVRNSHLRKNEYYQNNVEGTENLLTTLDFLNVQKLIFTSSSSVYGNSQIPFSEQTEHSVLKPCSYYGQTKLLGEGLVRHWTDEKKQAIVLRPFSVYGQHMRPDLAIPIFIRALELGETVEVFGDGCSSRDYTHIDDLVRAIHLAINHFASMQNRFQMVNIGTGKQTGITELIELLAKYLNVTPSISFRQAKSEEMLATQADISKAQNVFGFKSDITIQNGLFEMIK